jgi:hypothetical protein
MRRRRASLLPAGEGFAKALGLDVPATLLAGTDGGAAANEGLE